MANEVPPIEKDAGTVASGLTNMPKAEWPKPPADPKIPVIDLLKPNSVLHNSVREYLLKRLTDSERKMSQFYARWRWNEMRVQAYIDLPDYEKAMKEANRTGQPPKVTSIIMPYAFSTMATIVTYLIQALAGRKPIFQVSTYNDKMVDSARNMETMLQYNCDHTRLVRHLFQFFNDGELYGLGVLRTAWRQEKKLRTVFKATPKVGWLSLMGSNMTRVREEKTIFEGTQVVSQDPFMFFPDPRVPMADVNRKGEFVFWRTYEGRAFLKKEEADGRIKWVNDCGELPKNNANESGGQSARGLLSQGDSVPGGAPSPDTMRNYIQMDQGTIDIIPAELGIGTEETVQRWIFAIGNKTQIVQAEKLELDHDMHPVVVSEPYTLGYGFGQPGISDYLGPVQDTISWFINSHIHNVRSVLNNMVIVDPSQVEMQDLKNPDPGKIIRLKRAAYGKDVRQALQQMQMTDVTSGHIGDVDIFMRIGDAMAAVNDNLRGLNNAGGRKSATEVRTSAESGASRLSAHSRLISAQAMIDLAEQMCMNYQQNMSDEFYISVMGPEKKPIRIGPEQVVGDFFFPVNDGTLPIDRVALLDVWKEVMMAVMKDQELRSTYSVPKIFGYIADLGGAKNLDSMKMMPDEMAAMQAKAGNIVPTSALPQGGGQTPGVVSDAADRMAGALS